MAKRIILLHAYSHSMPPLVSAFKTLWPDADVLNLLDEALYADVAPDGTMHPTIPARVETLLMHCAASRADAVVFTGSTFGPAVETARKNLAIPVLKADEAMAGEAAERGGIALLVCTAGRAVPVIAGNIEAAARAAGTTIRVEKLVVAEAKAAISAGRMAEHDELVARAITAAAPPADSIVLGQVSMANVVPLLSPGLRAKTLTSAEATVRRLRALLEK
jgi:hypothetical protein